MSRSVNRVMILGNVGKEPEVKTIASGSKVANFSVATSESYKDKNSGEKKEVTEWINVVAWKGLAEVCEKYVKKGNKIYIEGKFTTRTWEDENGARHYRSEVQAENIILLGSGQAKPEEVDEAPEAEGDDDLPF